MVTNNPEQAELLGFGEGLVPSHHGSIIMFTKCKDVSVDVTLRDTTACFRDLPVYYKGLPMFRNPRNFVLQDSSIEVDCSEDFSIHSYKGSYIKQGPNGFVNVTDSLKITILAPKQQEDTIFANWSFRSLNSIFGKCF